MRKPTAGWMVYYDKQRGEHIVTHYTMPPGYSLAVRRKLVVECAARAGLEFWRDDWERSSDAHEAAIAVAWECLAMFVKLHPSGWLRGPRIDFDVIYEAWQRRWT